MRLALAVTILAFSLPQNAFAQISDEHTRIIQEAIKDQLKDPDSAKIYINQGNASKAGDNGELDIVPVCGYVNAKNSYGGYVGKTAFSGLVIGKAAMVHIIDNDNNKQVAAHKKFCEKLPILR